MLNARDPQGRIWLEKRQARGIWAGLYCLPVFEDRDALLAALAPADRQSARDEESFVHVLTHKDLHLHPIMAICGSPPACGEGGWFDDHAWPALGLPAPVRKLLTRG
jgi:A/G-specific adenine glycosylase